MTRSEQNQARRRRQNREAARRHRANKAWATAEADRQAQAAAIATAQEKAKAESQARTCAVCQAPNSSTSVQGVTYCHEHGRQKLDCRPAAPAPTDPPLPTLPPIRRPDPLYFDPASDPFRPAFWAVIDPNPKPIQLPHTPLTALLHQPVGSQGVTYSVAEGHRDRVAEARAERLRQERSGR
jgi:hypothetical protein